LQTVTDPSALRDSLNLMCSWIDSGNNWTLCLEGYRRLKEALRVSEYHAQAQRIIAAKRGEYDAFNRVSN